jgi:hypothetical protein
MVSTDTMVLCVGFFGGCRGFAVSRSFIENLHTDAIKAGSAEPWTECIGNTIV